MADPQKAWERVKELDHEQFKLADVHMLATSIVALDLNVADVKDRLARLESKVDKLLRSRDSM